MKLDSKYFDRIRTKRRVERPERSAPTCQWDGCEENAVHRAPVGRNAEGQYFMFCFEHVKEYNKGYNYFSGLSDGEIARYQKEAITGHRPTWTIGVNKASKNGPTQGSARSGSAGAKARIRDPFGLFGEGKGSRGPAPGTARAKTEDTGGKSLRYARPCRQCDGPGRQNRLQSPCQKTSPRCKWRR
jgi:curved DNA-binding protein CbpA